MKLASNKSNRWKCPLCGAIKRGNKTTIEWQKEKHMKEKHSQ